ncbi:MAG TPA: superinfection immunity protein [Terriglobales bacterium]|nr:superinfection immunity protein [Terriglobales bacterium]
MTLEPAAVQLRIWWWTGVKGRRHSMVLAAFVFFPFLFGPFFGFGFLIYFLPTIVALVRHKQNVVSILLLNLFLGWTLIGWIVALVWASTVDMPAAVR